MSGEDTANVVAFRFPSPDPKEHARPCGVAGCTKRTSDQKPYCVIHLNRVPYVKKLLGLMSTMKDEDLYGNGERAPKKSRRRQVVPVEVQVSETRFWVGLVKSRGVEDDPPAIPRTNPARVRAEFHAKLHPFTKMLTRHQSRHVLLCLQSHEAHRIPRGWLVSDERVIADVVRKFSPRGKKAD